MTRVNKANKEALFDKGILLRNIRLSRRIPNAITPYGIKESEKKCSHHATLISDLNVASYARGAPHHDSLPQYLNWKRIVPSDLEKRRAEVIRARLTRENSQDTRTQILWHFHRAIVNGQCTLSQSIFPSSRGMGLWCLAFCSAGKSARLPLLLLPTPTCLFSLPLPL